MDYLVYDCEIIKCIPSGERVDYLEYCEGWHDYKGMGISVIGMINSKGEESVIVPNRPDDPILFPPGLLIGFNSINFDDKLMAANGINVTTGYDLLQEIRLTAFGSTRWNDTPRGSSYSLGAIGEANGFPKTGSGELAPVLWQQGRYQEVIDYCLNDARITKALLELGLAGDLIDPNTGRKLRLRPLPSQLSLAV